MTEHERHRDDVADYLLGALNEDERGAFERHLRECDECQDEFDRLQPAAEALPASVQRTIDPDGAFAFIRDRVLAYVESELIAHEMNAFDAALALMALAHLGADVSSFTPALHVVIASLGEGGRHGPYKAYEWNKMKTPTRILVGGPEVTSAFVLMGLALARRAMRSGSRPA